MRRIASALLIVAAILIAACGGDEGGSATTTTAPATDDGAGRDLSTYSSVKDLAQDLDDAGLTCTLEYEGLKDADREVSLCAVNGEYTELSVWVDPSDAGAAASTATEADDPFVVGANWTVDVDTASTAAAVAAALGGEAVGTS